ncbi:MAG: S41 family peptidase [Acidobacteriota bacterium]|nr:S41 family peptidase [Acidobacteriota bacterium]
MRALPSDAKDFRVSRPVPWPVLCLLAAAVAVSALTWLGLNPLWGQERVPFADLRWRQGRPEIWLDGEWARLRSINRVSAERLIERAIAEWGPAYQDRFAAGFNFLLGEENGGLNILCHLTADAAGGEKSSWSLSTPRRYWSYSEAVAQRQRAEREPSGRREKPRPPRQKFPTDGSGWLSRADALEDLRRFEWWLEHRYAYLAKSETPYRPLLDDIADAAEVGISRRQLALRLEEILALFDDAHARVSFGASRVRLSEKTLPCELIEAGGRVACLDPGRRGYLDAEHPFLKSVNGVPLPTLRDELARLAPHREGAPLYPPRVLEYLKMTEYVAALTGQPFDEKVALTLESADGKNARTVTLDCLPHALTPDFTLPVETRILEGAVGYLALRSRMFPGERFKLDIVNAMLGLRHTKGLILDLRGNPGGHRDAIPLLLRYFIPPDELPQLVAVAFVRMDGAARPPAGTELLRNRMQWSESWVGWTAEERRLIRVEAERLIPGFASDEGAFSEPFFMLVRAEQEPGAYHYPHQVVVLHDGGTGSAAGLLLSALKGRRNVRLMGSASGSDSGYPQAYQLPRSQIVFWLSSMAAFGPGGATADVVEPDIRYQLTPDDLSRALAHGADPLLEQAAAALRR